MSASFLSARSLRRRCLRTPAASSMKPRRSSGVEDRIASNCPCPTMTCIWRPMPVSESSSWTSRSRTGEPLMEYSEPPPRNRVRLIVTSEYSMSSSPSALSIVRSTWARPNAARPDVPAKITSAMFEPRSARAPCSPMTQARASTTFDLPDPLGPTTHVMPGWRASVVVLAKDLNPRSVRVLRCILAGYRPLSKSRGTTGRFRASRCPRSPSRGSGSPCGGCSMRDPGHRGSCRRGRSSGRSTP